jgi:hypothetical protein
MILKRYCIDCGKIEPPEGVKCCPDSRVFWIEKDAAERINDMARGRGNTFGDLLTKLNKAEADLAQMTAWRDAAHRDREKEEQDCLQAMEERDRYHEKADDLANAIAAYFGREIGEHSNANCPWSNALEIIENAPARA